MTDRSKWEILIDRLAQLDQQAADLRAELEWMLTTPIKVHDEPGIFCSGCRYHLDTEGDFAKHYLVDDERFLNLGRCPTTHGERPADHHLTAPPIPVHPYTTFLHKVASLTDPSTTVDDLIREAQSLLA